MPEYLQNLNLLGLVGAILFLVIAAILGTTAYESNIGTLKFGSRWGFKKDEVKESQDAWNTAHKAAWPFLAMAGVLSLFHGIGCLAVAVAMGQDSHRMIQVLLITGLIVTIALYLLAQRVALNSLEQRR
ncbi:hypothetical protein [Schaalia vaccimaxillae]|uniref:hypothetical protein n=1 Tax=Schaalia vaccimaxillae TaxID=183916 RepID=UPI0003B3CFDE|nr:hypothetical protein [Schaalia vaccimaxillae]